MHQKSKRENQAGDSEFDWGEKDWIVVDLDRGIRAVRETKREALQVAASDADDPAPTTQRIRPGLYAYEHEGGPVSERNLNATEYFIGRAEGFRKQGIEYLIERELLASRKGT